MKKIFLCGNVPHATSNRLRPARRRPARLATLAAVAALTAVSFGAQPRSAQLVAYDEACYSIVTDPGRAEIAIGERADFDLSIAAEEGCLPVEVERWTFSPRDDHLLLVPDPAPGKEVGIEALEGALSRSYVTAQAELTGRLSPDPVATVQKQIEVRVYGGDSFELRVESFSAPPHVIAGRDFTVTVSVRSTLSSTIVPFVNTFRVGGVERSAFCPPLASRELCNLEFTLAAPDIEGRYAYRFCADATDVVPERSEVGNCVTGALDVGPVTVVDLAADGLISTPAPSRVGQPTQVTAVTRNLGGEPSGAFTVTVETPDGRFTESCPGLEPLATCSRTVVWEPTRTGLQTLRFQIDDTGRFDADPLNDWTHLNVDVAPGPSLPDLAVLAGDIRMVPAAPKAGDATTFEVEITNLGAPYQPDPSDALETAFAVSRYTDRLPCLPDSKLDTGETCTVRFTRTLDEPGPQTLLVWTDSASTVRETDERNNFGELHFVVGEADSNVTCQGNWSLVGTGSTTFDMTSPGSVVDDCHVYFGQNRPAGCWRTVGDEDLQVTWHRGSGSSCPTSATVTEPEAPFQTWTFDVFIQ